MLPLHLHIVRRDKGLMLSNHDLQKGTQLSQYLLVVMLRILVDLLFATNQSILLHTSLGLAQWLKLGQPRANFYGRLG